MGHVNIALDDALGAMVDVLAMLGEVRQLEGGGEAVYDSDAIICLEAPDFNLCRKDIVHMMMGARWQLCHIEVATNKHPPSILMPTDACADDP